MFFFIGGAAAVIFRIELLTPQGDLVQPRLTQAVHQHGIVMIFLF